MLSRMVSLIKKEFITTWKDPKSRGIIIMLPLLQLFIFANAITMEVKNIDMVVLDRSNTRISRDLISRFDGSPRFRHIIKVDDNKEFTHLITIQKAQLGLEINNDFASSISAKLPTSVQIIADGRQTNSASIASSYASEIVRTFSEELNPKEKANINIKIRNWYNPNLEYQWYILQILITLLSLVITLILTALSISREREMGTFDQLVVSPLTSFEILVGKTIPPLIIAMALTSMMTLIVVFGFHVPFYGSPLLYIFASLVSLLSIVGVGLFISSICKTQQQAMLGVLTFQMPAILLSGYISPIKDMPIFFQYLTWLDPIRFFMVVTRGIFFKNMGFFDTCINLIPLVFIAILTLSLASWTFKRQLD